MSEPINPLFEQEKAFLERKKLEYERALRGDVAQLKEQTANAGRMAIVGAGLAGSLWLITKALGGRKRKKQRKHAEENDYYPHQEYDYSSDHNYDTHYFGDTDFAEEDEEYAYANDRWQDSSDDYFADEDDLPNPDYQNADYQGNGYGEVYHSDSDSYDSPRPYEASDYHAAQDSYRTSSAYEADDLATHEQPFDFDERAGLEQDTPLGASTTEPFASEAYGQPDSTLPFDDSRRLPDSNDFAEPEHGYDFGQLEEAPVAERPSAPSRNLGSMLVGFAKSSAGKVVLGQAVSIGMALAAKALKTKLSGPEAETAKNSDLAAVTWKNDGYAHGHPATPQPDVTSAPANPSSHFQSPA